jgi:hypothetical protein
VRLLDPAAAVRAAGVTADVDGSPLADLAALIDDDLPGSRGHQRDRAAFPFAQLPADRVRELVAAPGRQLVQPGDQAVAGPGAVAGDHQRAPEWRRQRRDRRVQYRQLISDGVAAGRFLAQHPGQRLAGVVAVRQ